MRFSYFFLLVNQLNIVISNSPCKDLLSPFLGSSLIRKFITDFETGKSYSMTFGRYDLEYPEL